ncbi:MAG TPA: response regulator, partial [Polyangiaceae bacterium]
MTPDTAQETRPPPPRKILVADDDDGVRTGLVANLELEGYGVIEARDGAEAIFQIDQQPFDLIIS